MLYDKKVKLFIFLIIFPILTFGRTFSTHFENPPGCHYHLCFPPPTDATLYDQYPYSVMYYYGVTVSNALIRIVEFDINRWPEHIQSVEFAMTLSQNNFLRRLVSPLVNNVQLAADFTLRDGCKEPTIYEFDPYVGFRWSNFIWDPYVTTSLAIGEGVSYTTSIPTLEKKNKNNDSKRLLNYLRLEATFALPCYPRLQLVPLIHHRSGAWGAYGAGNTGSNDISLGLRYLF